VESVTSETSTFLQWGREPKPIVPERGILEDIHPIAIIPSNALRDRTVPR